MPLVPCPDCGRQISDVAPACIGCGRPMTPSKKATQRISIAPIRMTPPDAVGRDAARLRLASMDSSSGTIYSGKPVRRPGVAARGLGAICSLVLAGLGHLVQGRTVTGVSVLALTVVAAVTGYVLHHFLAVFVIVICNLMSAIDCAAWNGAPRGA